MLTEQMVYDLVNSFLNKPRPLKILCNQKMLDDLRKKVPEEYLKQVIINYNQLQ